MNKSPSWNSEDFEYDDFSLMPPLVLPPLESPLIWVRNDLFPTLSPNSTTIPMCQTTDYTCSNQDYDETSTLTDITAITSQPPQDLFSTQFSIDTWNKQAYGETPTPIEEVPAAAQSFQDLALTQSSRDMCDAQSYVASRLRPRKKVINYCMSRKITRNVATVSDVRDATRSGVRRQSRKKKRVPQAKRRAATARVPKAAAAKRPYKKTNP